MRVARPEVGSGFSEHWSGIGDGEVQAVGWAGAARRGGGEAGHSRQQQQVVGHQHLNGGCVQIRGGALAILGELHGRSVVFQEHGGVGLEVVAADDDGGAGRVGGATDKGVEVALNLGRSVVVVDDVHRNL